MSVMTAHIDPASSTGTISILIVEDEGLIALDLQSRVERMGYRVAGIASTGEDAIRLAGQTHPDVVLMDIRLGGQIDGTQAALEIHEQYGLPVIYLTAHADREILERAKRAQPYGYLVKPLQEEDLLTTIEVAVYKHRADRAERERLALAEVLNDTAAALNSTLELDEMLGRIQANLERIVPHDLCTLMILSEDRALRIYHRAVQAQDREFESYDMTVSPTTVTALTQMLDTGGSICIPDTEHADGSLDIPGFSSARSYIGVPVRLNGEIVGFLHVGSRMPGRFSPVDLGRLRAFADHAAIAIQNARLFQALESHSQALEIRVAERTQELLATKDRIEAILHHAPDAILMLDQHGTIQTANPALSALFNQETDRLIGQHILALIQPAHHPSVEAALASVLVGTVSRLEVEAVPRQGNEMPFDAELLLAPIHRDPELQGIVCVIRDISVFKELARMKDQFVSNVSHELRTPIANIKLYHDLLTLRPEKLDRYLEILKRETSRLQNIVESLLLLATLEHRAVSWKPVLTDLTELAHKYVADRVRLAEERGITLSFQPAADIPPVLADRTLLEQAVGNLLTNAMQYTPSGGEVVVATAMQIGEDGRTWAGVSVTDSGPGIPIEERDRIFERFFRGKAGLTANMPGTGLGLSIVKDIVNRHNGYAELSCNGAVGHGTTFWIWLPAALDSEGEAPGGSPAWQSDPGGSPFPGHR
ncbi:MAG: hypothetical protein Kow00124_28570 [Anaerolineae bacterium]